MDPMLQIQKLPVLAEETLGPFPRFERSRLHQLVEILELWVEQQNRPAELVDLIDAIRRDTDKFDELRSQVMRLTPDTARQFLALQTEIAEVLRRLDLNASMFAAKCDAGKEKGPKHQVWLPTPTTMTARHGISKVQRPRTRGSTASSGKALPRKVNENLLVEQLGKMAIADAKDPGSTPSPSTTSLDSVGEDLLREQLGKMRLA